MFSELIQSIKIQHGMMIALNIYKFCFLFTFSRILIEVDKVNFVSEKLPKLCA